LCLLVSRVLPSLVTGNTVGDEKTYGYVNFFIDDVYIGTNNAFVPTRGSRLWIALWPQRGKYVTCLPSIVGSCSLSWR
jgi:hypothetical protein